MPHTLSERARQILEAIIEEYIATAEPVGSGSIANSRSIAVSSATIRNVMADLEERGLISSPHTSAGRIPTEKGYRFYVDTIIATRKLSRDEKKEIVKCCRIKGNTLSDILKDAGKALSSISHYMGLVVAPSFNSDIFRHIEFVRLGSRKILAILVTANGIVQNRVVDAEKDFGNIELASMSNYLNSLIQGMTIAEAKEKILNEMQNEKVLYDSILTNALKMSRLAVTAESVDELYIEGRSNIFDHPEFTDIKKMKDIFEAFEHKSSILNILNRCLSSDGVQIFIGSESPLVSTSEISMVASRFITANNSVGLLGVIGPTRMGYSNVIPVVDYTAKMVTKLLNK